MLINNLCSLFSNLSISELLYVILNINLYINIYI